MSDSFRDDSKNRHLNSHVYGLSLVSKNCAVPVHQKVALSDKCKFCREAPAIGHRKNDPLVGAAARDWVSLAVEALRDAGAGGKILLGNGRSWRERHSVSTVHNPVLYGYNAVYQVSESCISRATPGRRIACVRGRVFPRVIRRNLMKR